MCGERMMKICQTALCFSLFCPPLAPHERAEEQIECLRRENTQSSLFQLLQKQHGRCNEVEPREGHSSAAVGQTAPPTWAHTFIKSSRCVLLLWTVSITASLAWQPFPDAHSPPDSPRWGAGANSNTSDRSSMGGKLLVLVYNSSCQWTVVCSDTFRRLQRQMT